MPRFTSGHGKGFKRLITAKHLAATLAPLLALGALSNCGSNITGPYYELVVEVRRGPTSPVFVEGEDGTAPVTDAEVVVALGAHDVAKGFSDSTGIVSFSLPAARYLIRVDQCPFTLGLPAPVEVQLGPDLQASPQLVCDTGIR